MKKPVIKTVELNHFGRRRGMSRRLLELLQGRRGWWEDRDVAREVGLPLSIVRPALHYLRKIGALSYRKQIQYRLDGRRPLDRILRKKKKCTQ